MTLSDFVKKLIVRLTQKKHESVGKKKVEKKQIKNDDFKMKKYSYKKHFTKVELKSEQSK